MKNWKHVCAVIVGGLIWGGWVFGGGGGGGGGGRGLNREAGSDEVGFMPC